MKSTMLLVAVLLSVPGGIQAQRCQDLAQSAKAVRSWVEVDRKMGVGEGALLGSSFVEKSVQRMGDEMAVNLLRAYSDDEMMERVRLGSILTYLEAAFSEPGMITCKENRRPRVTVLLLRGLRDKTDDETLRKRIAVLESKLGRL